MAEPASAALEMLRRRVGRVAEVSALTARALKLAQAASGIEMELLRLELAIAREPDNAQLVQELHETESNALSVQEEQAACAAEIAEAEKDVAALDELIARAKGG